MKHKKNSVKNVILMVLACLFCSLMTISCSYDKVASITVDGKSEIKVGDFDYADYTVQVTYESGKVETMSLEKDMLSDSDKLKFFTAGEHILTVNHAGKTATFDLTVCLYEFKDLKFDDVNVVYSGKEVTAEVFKNYPEGTDVFYPNGNSFVNAGTYTVTAIISRRNYVSQTKTATVTISPAEYDMSGVAFKDCLFDYDGETHTAEITGKLPDGVSVIYPDNNNKKVNAGEYTVTAKFSSNSGNYYLPKEYADGLTAKMTINKKKYDVNDLVFNDSTVTYDGDSHFIEAENVPSGVTVEYKVQKKVYDTFDVDGNEFTDAGTYIYTAKFVTDPNYEEIEPKQATLVIEQAEYDTSKIILKNEEFDYDGIYRKIEEFYYDGSSEPKNIKEIVDFLPDGMSIYDQEYKKNGKIVYSSVEKIDEDDYMTTIAKEVADYGTYAYTLILYDEKGNYKNAELTTTLTINKKDYDVSALSLSEEQIKHTGNLVSIMLNGVPKKVCEESGEVVYDKDGRIKYREHGNVLHDENGDIRYENLGTELYYFKIDTPVFDKDGNIGDYIKKDNDDPAEGVTDVGDYLVLVVFTGQDNPNYNYLSPLTLTFSVVQEEMS